MLNLLPTVAGEDDDALLASVRQRYRKVAIVHYWLVTMRGGERVVERLLHLFPGADIFTHVYDESRVSRTIAQAKVTTSFIQRLPGAARHYQKYLPLMPMALEQLDLRGYDLVISSESGPAKGVITDPDAMHLCYVHSPMRYLWDHYHQYRESTGAFNRAIMPFLFHRLRTWDVASASRVDRYVANSRFIQRRIGRAWDKPSTVVHPPVDVSLFSPSAQIDQNYLWVGQLVPYKRPDLAVEAFNRLGLPLLLVGEGPMAAALRRMAGPNVTIIPRLDFASLRAHYARCRGFVFTAEEDFGIVPVEVMASGRPVIAFGKGGALDSIVDQQTGLFFGEQTVDSLIDAVSRFEDWLPSFDPAVAVLQASRFSPAVFDSGILRSLM